MRTGNFCAVGWGGGGGEAGSLGLRNSLGRREQLSVCKACLGLGGIGCFLHVGIEPRPQDRWKEQHEITRLWEAPGKDRSLARAEPAWGMMRSVRGHY